MADGMGWGWLWVLNEPNRLYGGEKFRSLLKHLNLDAGKVRGNIVGDRGQVTGDSAKSLCLSKF
ncbi:hypothetical protein B6N60_03747 [Richelia sinica FACHB-800]|uniref:Uncharacterized protein n=1 Tax=Richelia sinica FACHB-800 TaxID=1357546 RepID=A0A975TBK0_9NOST|nr:hypothetical protein B6N60_03747 [Richelia sinica FACHB-800]